MGIATLIITDGSTTADLLATGYGFHLADWPQVITGYKGGGTIQDSPLADGRRLVDKKFVDGIETFTLRANATNQDALADDMQDLLRLLEQATDYWSGWYDTPVYLEVKWNNETNTRYAIVKNYQAGILPNPFGQPFLQANCEALYDEFTLVIERGPWLSNVPGEETATAAAATESYDGRTLGNVDSTGTAEPVTSADVFVANKDNEANLTDIYNFDDSLGTFSANLMDAALPFTLFPGTPALDDIVYFGIDTGVSDSGPFSSLVFDIGTAAAYSATLIWEYWSGAAWSTLTVFMTTSGGTQQTGATYFTATGRISVSWKQPSGWAATAINGVTAFWVRIRISAFTSWTTNPTQQNRDIYSVTWPYVRIASDQVLGDLPALMRLRFSQRNGELNDSVTGTTIDADRVIVGLRSESRGSSFTPFLNCSDEQNPSGMLNLALTNTSVVSDPTAPTGKRSTYNPSGTESMAGRFEFNFLASLAPQYVGLFRVFVRAQQVGGSVGDIQVRITIKPFSASAALFISKTLSFVNVGQQELLDFGQVELPGIPLDADDVSPWSVRIEASAASGTPDLYLYDLILMPVDEWAGEFLNPLVDEAEAGLDDNKNLDMDSVTFPKITVRSLLRTLAGQTEFIWQNITNGPAILQANADQRLWFLAARKLNDAWYADFEILSYTQTTRNQRYLSARGDR